ncbi:hypothetical protein BKA63DRAFT_488192 [Paraphoma chrysanthemicola]|nr:hypothetical protein BKA63DRAFT_488192 [Paraphoma chrysanthemicola]
MRGLAAVDLTAVVGAIDWARRAPPTRPSSGQLWHVAALHALLPYAPARPAAAAARCQTATPRSDRDLTSPALHAQKHSQYFGWTPSFSTFLARSLALIWVARCAPHHSAGALSLID